MINIALLSAMSVACVEAATFGAPVAVAQLAPVAVTQAAPVQLAAVAIQPEEGEEPPETATESAESDLTPPPADDLRENPVSNTPDNLVLEEEQFSGPLVFEGESDEEVTQRVVDYLADIDTLQGDFSQIAPSGAVSTGRFYLRRPGLLRFEYDPPTPLLIVANGGIVYVEDQALETTDSYPVGKTPLKFLLRDKVDLGKAEVVSVDRGVDTLAVTLSSKEEETEGELSIIVSAPEMVLERWIVRDIQGGITIVTLDNVKAGERLANRLFRAPDAGGTFLKN